MSETRPGDEDDISREEEDRRLFEIIADYMDAAQRGEALDPADLLERHPQFQKELRQFLEGHQVLARAIESGSVDPEQKMVPLLPEEFGDYELLEPIQRGGMGIVYRARHRTLDRIVALKVIISGPLASEAELQRFVVESRAAAQLDHPNIVPVLEAGEFSGFRYYTMPLIRGGSLTDCAKRFQGRPREVAALLSTLARAVQHAHERGVLHRDLKPGNVLIDEKSAPYITDFGLAKMTGADTSITQTGAVVGTPAYMSPELASGERGTTTATDIYSLGAILYELLTGCRPFQAETPVAVMTRVKYDEPARPRSRNPAIDPDLETICLRCLEKDPKRRFPSAAELADELERYLEGEPIHSRPVRMPERVLKWIRRRPALASLAGLLCLSLTVLLVGGILYHLRLQEKVDESRRRLFAAEMNLAVEAWRTGQMRSLRSLLLRQVPEAGERDLRSFEWRHLWRLAKSVVLTVTHREYGSCAAFDPEDKLLAVGYPDGDAVLVDLRRGERMLGFETDNVHLRDLAFAPDGRHLAGVRGKAGVESELVLWSVGTGLVEHAGQLPGAIPMGVGFIGPDVLLVSNEGGELMVWSRPTWELAGVLDAKRPLRNLDVSADCRMVVLMAADGRLAALPLPPSGDGKAPGEVLEQLRTALSACSWQAVRSAGGPTALALAPGHQLRASVSLATDEGARIVMHGPDSDLPLAHLSVQPVAGFLLFSPGGSFFATGGRYTTVWKLSSLLEPGVVETGSTASSLALAPEAGLFAAGDRQGEVILRNLETGEETARRQSDVGRISALALSRNGDKVAIGGEYGNAVVWSPAPMTVSPPLGPHLGVIRSLAFSPDGHRLAVGSFRRVLLWDIAAGTAQDLVTDGGSVYSLVFSPDGRTLWIGTQDGSVAAWSPPDRDSPWLLPPGETAVWALASSPDGSRLAAGFGDGRLCLYDVPGRRVVFSRRGHENRITTLAFSPDGRSLVSASRDLHLKFWDLSTGQQRMDLQAARQAVGLLDFTPDGQKLVALDVLGRIRTWHAAPDGLDPEFQTMTVEGWPEPVPGSDEPPPDDPEHWTLRACPALEVGGGCQGLAWEDPDGDGDLDLYLACVGPDRFLRNEGSGELVDATASIFMGRRNSKGLAWGDLDGDGDLDLCVTNRDGPNRFFANDGGLAFSDWPGVHPAGRGSSPAIALADFDRDGDLDAFVCRTGEKSLLLRNDGQAFVNVAGDRDVITQPSTSASWADFTGDGLPDLFLCTRTGRDRLLANLGDGDFQDVSGWLEANPSDSNSRCGAWGDYDNDGDLDLYICRRGGSNSLLRNDGARGFSDATAAPLGDRRLSLGALWGDFDHDGDLDLFVGDNAGRSLLLRNDGVTEDPSFTDVTTGPLRYAGSAYAMAWADFDGDGDLDLTVADWDDAVRIFRNDLDTGHHWLQVRLRGATRNTAGIGARIRVTTDGRSQVREISGGPSSATYPLRAHFGLGTASRVEEIEIRWPSGILQTHRDVPVDQLLVLEEDG